VCDPRFLSDLVVARGVAEWLEDIDEGRKFQEAGGIIGAGLRQAAFDQRVLNAAVSWVSGYQDEQDPQMYYRSPREYRERYQIESMRRMFGGN